MDPDQDVPDDFDDDLDDEFFDDDEVEPAAVSNSRYKRRIEQPAPSSGTTSNATTWVFVGLAVAAIVGLLLWLQPWKSTPLDVVSVQNERVDLAEFPGANGCFWRFEIEIANTANERVWVTGVELFMNDQIVRPEVNFGSLQPGIESAIPVEVFLGNTQANGRCLVPERIDHSPVDVLHATLDEMFTARIAF